MEQLEASSRRAAHLLEDGLPSVASWLQLRSYIKEIAAELVVLREYEVGICFAVRFIIVLQ